MSGWPKSLYGRMLAIGLVSTAAALLFAGFAIGNVLERFVLRAMDDRLDAQAAVLAGAMRPDGRLDPARVVNLPGFGSAGSGWVWQVTAPAGRWSSTATPVLATAPDDRPPPPGREDHVRDAPGPGERGPDGRGPVDRGPGPPGDDRAPRPDDARDGSGQRLHGRTVQVDTPAGPATVAVFGPRRIIAAPIREAMVPLLGSLALLGFGLMAGTLVQLRIGFRPLRAVEGALADVRAGRARTIPPDQPRELAPLATEINALIAQNEAGLAHARQHVANLTHGLKTPLAALALKLAEGERDPDGALGEMVRQIDRRVHHHLGRARAAAPGGGGRVRTAIAPAVEDLAAVLSRIHADRAIVAETGIAPDLAVAVDPQDLDEMLGNILDNGWRHARAAIRIAAQAEGPAVAITVEDDGPGLDNAAIDQALIPGRRLDESGGGHGFGLPIARELAELNGGALALRRSERTGGLRVTITLPG